MLHLLTANSQRPEVSVKAVCLLARLACLYIYTLVSLLTQAIFERRGVVSDMRSIQRVGFGFDDCEIEIESDFDFAFEFEFELNRNHI